MSRGPNYQLKALDKESGVKSARIGAGWLNEDGSVSIKLNWPAVLHGSPDLVLTLFPIDDKEKSRAYHDDDNQTPF